MKRLNLLLNLIIVITLLLVACGTSSETAEPDVATNSEYDSGSKLIFVRGAEADTFDVHKSGRITGICEYFGASLIAKDPETGEYVPYLAESWTVAEDGLSYEFKLREDVLFHDGTPLTAHDYAWSFNRAKDPATKSPTAGPSLKGLAIAEAVDDYTLRFKMAWPNSALMNTLTDACYHQPLSQAYVEEMGDEYGQHPIGVGPFKFKEWIIDERTVLERNPAFTWGPEFTRGTPPQIEILEFRIIPEYATQLAGLENREIDYVSLETKDVERIESLGQFQIISGMNTGSGTHIVMNTTRPPFDDVRVRRAFNHAVNREPLIKIVTLGTADPLYGMMTPATLGYWSGVEELGYSYNPDEALALLAEAGYILGDDGWLEKDGQPLVLDMKVSSYYAKEAEILQQQFKDLGIQIKLQQLEMGVLFETLASYDFDLSVESLSWPDFGIAFPLLHSNMVGIWNRAGVSNLDDMIGNMTAAPSWEQAVDAAELLQKEVIEQAYYVPLFADKYHIALSNRVKGTAFLEATKVLYLFDAYIEGP